MGKLSLGAHYVPIANKESTYVRQLFEELKIIQGYDRAGEPIYDELMLCHEPQDRLYKDGAFHEGLVPKRGLQKNESADIARFFSQVLKFRQATGDDGKPAFAIPLDSSSADKTYRDLDKLSMAQWLKENNFCSEPLLWYINYCCRDDYGATIEKVSAWAGIHYFAGRRGTAANAEPNAVLTWPQGNGYLVERLRSLVGAHIHTNSMVTAISEAAETVRLNVMEARSKSTTSRQSELVIFAAPRFIASKLIAEQAGMAADLQYAPWLVANIAIKGLPESRGAAPAWDNVSYYSDSLGYVMANHQEITTRAKASVITYYYPLSDKPPKLARKFLYTASADNLAAMIVRDLEKMHPGIKQQIISMDLWPWGHGMISPGVDFIWSGRRQKLKESKGNILFAHSDMSGISNFEEAKYEGVEAAKQVLARRKDS